MDIGEERTKSSSKTCPGSDEKSLKAGIERGQERKGVQGSRQDVVPSELQSSEGTEEEGEELTEEEAGRALEGLYEAFKPFFGGGS